MIKSVVGASWGEVGPACGYSMLAPLRPAWSRLGGYVGPSLSYVGPSWGYVGLSWGHVGPACGPGWAIWGLCWASLRAFWGVCWVEKMAKPQNTVNRGMFVGSAPSGAASTAGAGAPLSYGKKKNARPRGHRAPWPDLKGYRPLPPTPVDRRPTCEMQWESPSLLS